MAPCPPDPPMSRQQTLRPTGTGRGGVGRGGEPTAETDLEELQPRQEVGDVAAERLQRRVGLAAPHAGDLAGHAAGEDLLQLCRHHHQTCRQNWMEVMLRRRQVVMSPHRYNRQPSELIEKQKLRGSYITHDLHKQAGSVHLPGRCTTTPFRRNLRQLKFNLRQTMLT